MAQYRSEREDDEPIVKAEQDLVLAQLPLKVDIAADLAVMDALNHTITGLFIRVAMGKSMRKQGANVNRSC